MEEREDREPKSKLEDPIPLELDDAIGADLPWGFNPNSLPNKPSKSFIVRERERDLVSGGVLLLRWIRGDERIQRIMVQSHLCSAPR